MIIDGDIPHDLAGAVGHPEPVAPQVVRQAIPGYIQDVHDGGHGQAGIDLTGAGEIDRRGRPPDDAIRVLGKVGAADSPAGVEQADEGVVESLPRWKPGGNMGRHLQRLGGGIQLHGDAQHLAWNGLAAAGQQVRVQIPQERGGRRIAKIHFRHLLQTLSPAYHVQVHARGRFGHGVLEIEAVRSRQGDGVVDIPRPVGGAHKGRIAVRVRLRIDENVEQDRLGPPGADIVDEYPMAVMIPAEIVAQLIDALLVNIDNEDRIDGLLMKVGGPGFETSVIGAEFVAVHDPFQKGPFGNGDGPNEKG